MNGQGGQQQNALARPVIVPQSFSARGDDDWTSWLASFNAACVVNGYGDGDRIRFMAARLEGTAHQIFTTISAANANATYAQLCALLTDQFEPPQQQQLFEAQLRVRTKGHSESQYTFAAALRALANRAFPGQAGQILNRLVLQQFIDGQTSPEVRLQLATNRPADLDDAVQRAISVTTAYQMEAMRNSGAQSSQNLIQPSVAAAQVVPQASANSDSATLLDAAKEY